MSPRCATLDTLSDKYAGNRAMQFPLAAVRFRSPLLPFPRAQSIAGVAASERLHVAWEERIGGIAERKIAASEERAGRLHLFIHTFAVAAPWRDRAVGVRFTRDIKR